MQALLTDTVTYPCPITQFSIQKISLSDQSHHFILGGSLDKIRVYYLRGHVIYLTDI